jgi:hypothetical protein
VRKDFLEKVWLTAVEHLPNKCDALNSNPVLPKRLFGEDYL